MQNSKTNLISYYPEFLQENLEFNAICDASNPEYDLIWEKLKQIELNIVPQSANEDGIAEYEKWLGLVTNPYIDLETRRATVIAKLNETLPYTEIRLQRMLAAIVGWGHFVYTREGAFVKVILDEESGYSVQAVRDLLERVLPLNLHYEVIFRGAEFAAIIDLASVCLGTVVFTTELNNTLQTATVYHGSPYLYSVLIETGENE